MDQYSGRVSRACAVKLPCPICSATSDLIVHTKDGYDIARCAQCNTVHASPLPSQAELDSFYDGFTYLLPDAGEFARHRRHVERGAARFMPVVGKLLNRRPHHVLDFGGGLGFISAAMAGYCDKVVHFDLDPQSRDYARKHFNGQIASVDDIASALSFAPYDFILLNQVIEHVREPVAFLRQFAPALASDGVLVVTTPNNRANDFWLRPDMLAYYYNVVTQPPIKRIESLATNSWLCCDPPRHLYAFDQTSLTESATRAGFEIIRTETVSLDSDPYGQPKYRFAGFDSARNLVRTLLFMLTKITGPISRLINFTGRNGTNLICYLRNSA